MNLNGNETMAKIMMAATKHLYETTDPHRDDPVGFGPPNIRPDQDRAAPILGLGGGHGPRDGSRFSADSSCDLGEAHPPLMHAPIPPTSRAKTRRQSALQVSTALGNAGYGATSSAASAATSGTFQILDTRSVESELAEAEAHLVDLRRRAQQGKARKS